jgi:hypothetical protein
MLAVRISVSQAVIPAAGTIYQYFHDAPSKRFFLKQDGKYPESAIRSAGPGEMADDRTLKKTSIGECAIPCQESVARDLSFGLTHRAFQINARFVSPFGLKEPFIVH